MRRDHLLGRLIRMAASSSAASTADLLTLFSLVNLLRLWPAMAGVLGCLAGGAVNFVLNRKWVFASQGPGWLRQLLSYGLLVVLGGALITGTIIQLGISLLGLPVIAAKLISAALVLVCWNYPISRHVVFLNRCRGPCAEG